jgi:histidyl-tRNA synthetase
VSEKNKERALREIDKIGKISEKEIIANLKKIGAGKLFDALKQGENYFNKFQSYKEIVSLMGYCRIYGVKILFSPSIVRGLSYYNGTVFEIKAKGIRETIVAGGSYKFNDVQCTGISFGLERISALAKVKTDKEKYVIISLNKDKEAIKIAQRLREKNKNCTIYYGKPSKALEYANANNILSAIFVGEKEVKSKKFKVKNLQTGKETPLKI